MDGTENRSFESIFDSLFLAQLNPRILIPFLFDSIVKTRNKERNPKQGSIDFSFQINRGFHLQKWRENFIPQQQLLI